MTLCNKKIREMLADHSGFDFTKRMVRPDGKDSPVTCTKQSLPIRMVAGFAEVAERKEGLIAGACNHPNWLGLPFPLSETYKTRGDCRGCPKAIW